jgi:hypothetical protein
MKVDSIAKSGNREERFQKCELIIKILINSSIGYLIKELENYLLLS